MGLNVPPVTSHITPISEMCRSASYGRVLAMPYRHLNVGLYYRRWHEAAVKQVTQFAYEIAFIDMRDIQ